MHIFTVNDRYERVAIVDGYQSFIWSERYDQFGDFKIVVPATDHFRSLLKLGLYLSFSESNRHMIITTSEEADGLLTVSGYSSEYILKSRLVRPGVTWSATAHECAAMTFNYAFIRYHEDYSLPGATIIPNSVYRYENVHDSQYTHTTELKTVYDSVQEILKTEDLGFYTTFEVVNGAPRLALTIYGGHDRTGLVFDPKVGTLDDVRILRSINTFSNVAYVEYKNADEDLVRLHRTVRGRDFRGDRNVIIPSQFSASHVSADGTDVPDNFADRQTFFKSLSSRGHSEIAANSYIRTIEGTVPGNSPIRYNREYALGDIVCISVGADLKFGRVSEYVWSISPEGVTQHPTFRFE